MISRAAIVKALETRLRDRCPQFETVDRKVRAWADVPPAEQPACFVALGGQLPAYSSLGAPSTWTVHATVYLYAYRDPQVSTVELPDLIDAVEAALEWDETTDAVPGGYPGGPRIAHQTTLGGLVQYARIVGEIQTDEGSLGNQQVAVLTVEMKTGA